jgi:hypothetical protein
MTTIYRFVVKKDPDLRNFIAVHMLKHPFIFSDVWKYRIQRHATFWASWWIFQAFLYSFIAINNATAYYLRLPLSLGESFLFMFCHMFLAYSLMYFVIPRFLLKHRYWHTVAWTLICFVITALLSVLIGRFLVDPLKDAMIGNKYVGPVRTYNVGIHLSLLAGLRGGLTVGGIAAAIKLMKYWYVKEQRNLQLQKENVEAQLQLLKAQIHPHFLFNTMNNIYSYTQNASPVAAQMVAGLSDILRFMLYECNQSAVPLSKELKMIKDYISLEQIRYGNKLDIHLDLPQNTNDLYIAPLLLLPLVENCFKHGASSMLDQPWVSLQISLNRNEMKMKLINGKVVVPGNQSKKPGIGMSNVKKRLELLYPGKHDLVITSDADVFIVDIKLELEQIREQLIRPVSVQQAIYA